MDPNESGGLSSYYQQPQPPQPPPSAPGTGGATSITSPSNGILPPNNLTTAPASSSPMVYSHSVPPTAVSTTGGGGLETLKRKRGRPRKYGTPEQAAAAKRLSSASAAAAASSSATPISPPKKKEHGFNIGGNSSGGGAAGGSSSKKFQFSSLGSTGQSFTPHVITVSAGEDVGQKIMSFLLQSKREICILSASGTISNVSLRQPATSGGSINYEGRFDILSLSGSFVRNETGNKSGGLSVCLASVDGQIIGGGVGGPLRAAGPVQVIVGTFVLDGKKDIAGAMKGDASAGKLPSPIGGAANSGVSFWSPNDSYQNIGGSQFMSHQPRNTQSLEWSTQPMEWRDRSGNDLQESPENGNYEHIPE